MRKYIAVYNADRACWNIAAQDEDVSTAYFIITDVPSIRDRDVAIKMAWSLTETNTVF
jgi:hypothetical protein